ncbi:Site-specific DNA recombinase [Fulvimarina manganoxydans]|uniref:Site-specific DNA recombinase n=1 Tax=Fulvimarina manganoxydans TaxID=937218 RepID=A0A1W2AQR0_9HYPH|nr:recombinase family protein [Fulvimarina manganoxydans]SMC63003.1 Site-specific DNA recombinase [Fulvimarina manganoxydans]
MPKRKSAIAYIRVSTKGQEENGGGLNLQLVSIEAYAKAAGYVITDTFRDAQSAVGEDSVRNRPGLRSAIEASHKTGRPIIVDGLDRFARNTKALEEMVASGRLAVISTRSGEDPRHAVTMAEASRAQAEAERISRTTRQGLEKARKRGVTLGNTKNLPEAREKAAEARTSKARKLTDAIAPIIRELREQKPAATKKEIAEELNRRGYLSPRGEAWTETTIRPQLKRLADMEENEREAFYQDHPLYGTF